jgi:hypothetical protein
VSFTSFEVIVLLFVLEILKSRAQKIIFNRAPLFSPRPHPRRCGARIYFENMFEFFGTASAGLRPRTNQLLRGERTFIRQNWKNMTDKEISKSLNLSSEAVKYYRMQFDLWKNRKGTSKQKHKSDGMKVYGKNCEVCNLPVTELHHIIPKSTQISDWAILCPTCHAVITRKLVCIENREDIETKLKPFMIEFYKNIGFKIKKERDSDTFST